MKVAPTQTTEPHTYTLQKLSDLTGVTRPFFYGEARKGRLRLKKLGGRTVVLAEDWRAYLASLPDFHTSK